MNWLISFSLFIFSIKAQASFLVTHNQQVEQAIRLKTILIRKFNIPAALIRLEQKENPCREESSELVQVCIDNKGRMKPLRFPRDKVKRVYGVFLKRAEERKALQLE